MAANLWLHRQRQSYYENSAMRLASHGYLALRSLSLARPGCGGGGVVLGGNQRRRRQHEEIAAG